MTRRKEKPHIYYSKGWWWCVKHADDHELHTGAGYARFIDACVFVAYLNGRYKYAS